MSASANRDRERLTRAVEAYVAGLTAAPGALDEAGAVRFADARERLLAADPADAVPVLADALERPEFAVKHGAYAVLIEHGQAAVPALRAELGRRGPVTRLWLAAALGALGDGESAAVTTELLRHTDSYVRHLAALAAVFQGTFAPEAAREVAAVLVDALESDATIERTEFTVAGAALACLAAATGEPFLGPDVPVHFYNYERFAFAPPVDPFPFASDYLRGASDERRAELVKQARDWLSSREDVSLVPVGPIGGS